MPVRECVCASVYGYASWLTFAIEWHITELRPLTSIIQYTQQHLIHRKYTLSLHMRRRGELKDGDCISRHVRRWTLALCFSYQCQSSELLVFQLLQTSTSMHLPFELQPPGRGVLTKRHTNSCCYDFCIVCLSHGCFISIHYASDSLWQCQAFGRRTDPSFPWWRQLLPLSLSSSSHQWMELRDKVFLTVWVMGISDSISLGPPQTMHFPKANCIRYMFMEARKWLVSQRGR